MSRKNPHWGTTLDAFLAAEGIREAAKAEAVTRVVAWQLSQEMERQGSERARRRHNELGFVLDQRVNRTEQRAVQVMRHGKIVAMLERTL